MIKITIPKIFKSNRSNIRLMSIDKLKINPKYKSLYEAEADKILAICRSIKEHGLDPTQPLIILKDGTLIDGHSRLLAIKKAGLSEAYVIEKEGLASDTDVLIYEEHLQLSRRNLTESQKFEHLQNLLNLKKQAQAEGKDVSEFTDEAIAKKLDVSTRQVQKMRFVEAHATPKELELLHSGTSLNQISEEIKKNQGPSRKSPANKKTPKTALPSKDYSSDVLSLFEKYLPEIQIPESLRKDLAELFKNKE